MHGNQKINEQGHLVFGGADCTELAERFGTPLYVMDEDRIRTVCRGYRKALAEMYPDSTVCYASKAFCCQAIYRIAESEGLGADVVSGGELFTALTSGMDADRLYFHGNNKQAHEIAAALDAGVHALVADGDADFELIEEIARRIGVKARVLVRVNPGIEAHTHEFIQTAKADSKFGVALADGTAEALIERIDRSDFVEFLGLHCHVGSQIFELQPFQLAVDALTSFAALLGEKHGIEVREMNFGGGFGIRYLESDRPYKPYAYAEAIAERLRERVEAIGIPAPRLVLEPGRSIVGEAGMTLYTVGAIKEIPNVRKYLSVDGGMYENPRPALYGAEYEAVLANRAAEEGEETVSIAGKCCESGDVLIKDAVLPRARRGDLLAVFSTGAYNYSMASRYNRNPVPPVVLVKGGEADYIVRPETYEDLIARDAIPARLER